MINFIICDDNVEFSKKVRHIIDDYMMKSDVEYKCTVFHNYDNNLKAMIKKEIGFKVYILDIQMPDGSGLDITRMIREEYEDWASIILIITAYNEYKYDALGNRLFIMDFINKMDSCETKLKQDLARIISHYDHREKCLTYEFNRTVKKIEYKHILYIEKEKSNKNCKIVTSYGESKIGKSLKNLKEDLDNRFIKINKGILVNIDQIKEVDLNNNSVVFRNGFELQDIAKCKRSEVIKLVANY
jgi:Response regulator of the LytR/AlgR family